MDAGELQKRKLEETKQLVKKGASAGNKKQMGTTTSADQQTSCNESNPTSLIAIDEKLAKSSLLLSTNNFATENDYMSSELSLIYFSDTNHGSFISSDGSCRSEFSPQLGDESYDYHKVQDDVYSDYEKTHSPIDPTVLEYKSIESKEYDVVSIPQTPIHTIFDGQTAQLQDDHDLEMVANPNIDSNRVDCTHHILNLSPSTSATRISASGYRMPNYQRTSTAAEADLLLYYMEEVCERQFLVVTKANRGWLFMAVTKFDLSYWATLSLASYCQGSGTSHLEVLTNSSLTQSVESTKLAHFYTNLAILELRKTLLLLEYEQQSYSRILLCCFSMIQLMFLEVIAIPFVPVFLTDRCFLLIEA
jgi:hypothetical protein